MSEQTGLIDRVVTAFAMALATAICEPQIRLGRRRHDGVCDECDEPIDTYAGETLEFPLDDLDADATSSREKLRAMLNAEYRRVCLECWADLEDAETDSGVGVER